MPSGFPVTCSGTSSCSDALSSDTITLDQIHTLLRELRLEQIHADGPTAATIELDCMPCMFALGIVRDRDHRGDAWAREQCAQIWNRRHPAKEAA